MTTNLFTVYDAAAQTYLEPFHAPTIEYAIRQFRTSVETQDHMFWKYPEDYTLFHIGEFNQETGLIKANETPVNLGVAITFKPQNMEIVNG